jgi:hypothetical protein
MEFKGTKGKFYTKYVNGFIRVVDKDDNNVLDTPFKELNDANALLISKSPEMLEMLQRFVVSENTPLTLRKQAQQLIKEATTI